MLKNVLIFLYKLKDIVLKLYNEFLDFLFPPVCGICGKIDKSWLCEKCHKRIKKLKLFKYILIENDFIHKKYNNNYYKNLKLRNIEPEIKHYKNKTCINKIGVKNNKEIQLNEKFFDELIYIFKYSGLIRKQILKYKFNDCAYLYHFFCTIIFNEEKCCRKLKDYDIIIPVPMHKKKKAQRGYNQTELIAKELAQVLNIKLECKCVEKVKNTKTQSTLSLKDRKENIKNAFLVNNKESIYGKKIIIFDDIYTTGQTVNELSKVLKLAGAKEILIFVLAKD